MFSKDSILEDSLKSKGNLRKEKIVQDKWSKYFSVDVEGLHVGAAKISS